MGNKSSSLAYFKNRCGSWCFPCSSVWKTWPGRGSYCKEKQTENVWEINSMQQEPFNWYSKHTTWASKSLGQDPRTKIYKESKEKNIRGCLRPSIVPGYKNSSKKGGCMFKNRVECGEETLGGTLKHNLLPHKPIWCICHGKTENNAQLVYGIWNLEPWDVYSMKCLSNLFSVGKGNLYVKNNIKCSGGWEGWSCSDRQNWTSSSCS